MSTRFSRPSAAPLSRLSPSSSPRRRGSRGAPRAFPWLLDRRFRGDDGIRWRRWLLLLSLALTSLSAAPARAFFDPITQASIEKLPAARLAPDARLVDQDGRATTPAAYFGGPPLVFAPVVYDCPNLCGITLDALFAGLAGAGLTAGRDYRVVVVGIDPREGPAQAAKVFGQIEARWHVAPAAVRFLTGPAPEIGRVMAGMGVKSGWDEEHQQYAHISAAAVTTPDGRLSRWLMGVQFDPRALRLALVEAGRGKVGTLGDQVLLLCYGYDPVHGRYGWAVMRLLQAAAGVTVAGLGLFIWLSLRRQRRQAS